MNTTTKETNMNDAAMVPAAMLDELRKRIRDMQEAAYTFGEYSKEAVSAALDGVLETIDELQAAPPTDVGASPEPEDEEESAEDTWRRLALQFDRHRLEAIGHLRAMLQDAVKHADLAAAFLKAPPLDGEAELAQRVAAIAAGQAPVDLMAVRALIDYCDNECRDVPQHLIDEARDAIRPSAPSGNAQPIYQAAFDAIGAAVTVQSSGSLAISVKAFADKLASAGYTVSAVDAGAKEFGTTPTHRIGGSLLPSSDPGILRPLVGAHGTLQVCPMPKLDTYGLFLNETQLLAMHPNGYSCSTLAERILAAWRGERDVSYALEQFDYILKCGGMGRQRDAIEYVASGMPDR